MLTTEFDLMKKTFSFFLVATALLTAVPIIGFSQTNGSDDTPRVNGYWFNTGNPLKAYRGNCTWYAWGRAAEATGGGWLIDYKQNATGWFNGIHNGGAKDLNPEQGAIMCLPDMAGGVGHVSYVVAVADANHWTVEEYNVIPMKWSRENVVRDSGGKVHGDLFKSTRLGGFVHAPRLSDGLYRANSEATVFLVRNGTRRAIPSAACFDDWHFDWNAIRVVTRDNIDRFAWDVPLTHLIRVNGTATVYWVEDGAKRPITSASLFEAMAFRWDDVMSVTAGRRDSYPTGQTLSSNEGNFIVIDGPYESPNTVSPGQGLASGLRIRNIARSNPDMFVRFATSYWAPSGSVGNFPWSPLTYCYPGSEYVWWSSNISFTQRGTYAIRPAVIVNGVWHEIPHSGLTPVPPYSFTVR